MRKLLAAALVAATLAGAALVLAACGAEDVARVDAAEAAEATRKQGTARMTMRMRMTGAGLPQPITIHADGVTVSPARGRACGSTSRACSRSRARRAARNHRPKC